MLPDVGRVMRHVPDEAGGTPLSLGGLRPPLGELPALGEFLRRGGDAFCRQSARQFTDRHAIRDVGVDAPHHPLGLWVGDVARMRVVGEQIAIQWKLAGKSLPSAARARLPR